MRLPRLLFAACLVFALALTATVTDAAQQKKKKKSSHTVHGTIVEVHHDKNKKNNLLGTITVKVKGKNKTAGKAGGKSEKFVVLKSTHIEKHTAGKKGGSQNGTGNFRALHKGEHVVITTHTGHQADRIVIESKGKSKAKKKIAA